MPLALHWLLEANDARKRFGVSAAGRIERVCSEQTCAKIPKRFKIQDLGSRWILDPEAQVLSRDPGNLGSITSYFARDPMDLGSNTADFARDPMDLGSSTSDFARDSMGLGPCFLIFRGILSIFTDFITLMTYFCAKFKGFRSRLHFAWDTGYFASFNFDFTWDPEGSWILKFTFCVGSRGSWILKFQCCMGSRGSWILKFWLRGIQGVLDRKILA